MAQPDRQHYALQTIFSFFLGLMVLAFIGVGVITFYPEPQQAHQTELDALYQRQSELIGKNGGVEPTGTAAAELDQIQQQIASLEIKVADERKNWALNTSIILVLFATIVMGVSLVRSDQLRVLSNGLLLGGLFTMVYGMGWTISSESAGYLRFFVVVFALAVALALGYLKFVRLRTVSGASSPSASAPADTTELERRVASLEGRLAAVASAFSSESDSDKQG